MYISGLERVWSEGSRISDQIADQCDLRSDPCSKKNCIWSAIWSVPRKKMMIWSAIFSVATSTADLRSQIADHKLLNYSTIPSGSNYHQLEFPIPYSKFNPLNSQMIDSMWVRFRVNRPPLVVLGHRFASYSGYCVFCPILEFDLAHLLFVCPRYKWDRNPWYFRSSSRGCTDLWSGANPGGGGVNPKPPSF